MTEYPSYSRLMMIDSYAIGSDSMHLIQVYGSYLPTVELPSTTDTYTDVPESMMPIRDPLARVPAPMIRGQEHTRHVCAGRPGWHVNLRGTPNFERPRGHLVCSKCHGLNHIALDCVAQLSISESSRIIRNYDNLSTEDNQRVPTDSYWTFRPLDKIVISRARDLRNAETARTDANLGATVSKSNLCN